MFDTVIRSLQQDSNSAVLLVVLSLLIGILLILNLYLAFRVRRLNRLVGGLTRGMSGNSLEQVLMTHMDTVEQTVRRMETLEQAVAVLQAQMPKCLQRVGMVRYDAFDDVGGEQSFVLSLLDAQGDGIVLTSVYNRMDMRIYCKAIVHGTASHALSREEERALRESIAI